ncbi:MAG TPA: MFS transporter, partial [Phenylobacterium sp.]|nr:MFS transporter [Phenylobacterium sp.]
SCPPVSETAMSESSVPPPPTSARALLAERDYLLFWLSRWAGSLAVQIQSVALGWQIYELARRTVSVADAAFMVGMIGLATFIPVFLLTLPAGEAADRYDRRKVLLICYGAELLSVAVLAYANWQGVASVPLLLAVAAAFGAARAFMSPVGTAWPAPLTESETVTARGVARSALALRALRSIEESPCTRKACDRRVPPGDAGMWQSSHERSACFDAACSVTVLCIAAACGYGKSNWWQRAQPSGSPARGAKRRCSAPTGGASGTWQVMQATPRWRAGDEGSSIGASGAWQPRQKGSGSIA